MEQKLTKELAQKIMKIKGEARGVNLDNDARYVLKEKGQKGLRRVEEELEKVGCPLRYKEIRVMDFYPVGWAVISLLAIKKVFNWDDEDVKKIGAFSQKVSFIVKFFTKYFYSLERILKEAPNIWRRYFTIGELIVSEFDEKERYIILKIKDFELHPVYCRTMEGFFINMVKMIVRTEEITCEEKKCTFKGDGYHEFLLKW